MPRGGPTSRHIGPLSPASVLEASPQNGHLACDVTDVHISGGSSPHIFVCSSLDPAVRLRRRQIFQARAFAIYWLDHERDPQSID